MEELIPETDVAHTWADDVGQSLDQQRDRLRQFLSDQREQFDRIEDGLLQQITSLAMKAPTGAEDDEQTRQDRDLQAAALVQQTEQMDRRRRELDEREQKWGNLQAEALQQQRALVEKTEQRDQQWQEQLARVTSLVEQLQNQPAADGESGAHDEQQQQRWNDLRAETLQQQEALREELRGRDQQWREQLGQLTELVQQIQQQLLAAGEQVSPDEQQQWNDRQVDTLQRQEALLEELRGRDQQWHEEVRKLGDLLGQLQQQVAAAGENAPRHEQQQQWNALQADALQRQEALLEQLRAYDQRWGEQLGQLNALKEHVERQQEEDQRRHVEQQQLWEQSRQREAEALQRQESLLSEVQRGLEGLTQVREQIGQREEALQSRQQELEEKAGQRDQQRRELDRLELELERQSADLRQAQSALDDAQRKHEEDTVKLDRGRASLVETSAALKTQRSELAERMAHTESQRRRLSQQFKARRAEQLAEIEQRRAELQSIAASDEMQLQKQLVEATAERDRLQSTLDSYDRRSEDFLAELEALRKQRDQRQSELDEAGARVQQQQEELNQRQAKLDQLSAQLSDQTNAAHQSRAEADSLKSEAEDLREQSDSQQAVAQVALAQARDDQEELREQLRQNRKQLNERVEELGDVTAQLEQLRAQAAGGEGVPGEIQQEIAELRTERQSLLDRLAQAELRLKAEGAPPPDFGELSELQRRFEMAVEDVRELKARNADLEEELNHAGQTGGAAPTAPGQSLDWEEQKRQLMAQLDSDFDEDDPQDAQDRMTVDGTIRITDQVVADKDREIEELRKKLQDQPAAVGSVAVGATAVAEVLDQDELVQQERENLRQLQDEWREKLRKAEIDMSVERAKIARERAEMEEKLQAYEAERAALDNAKQGGADKNDPPEPTRGRWLARLGLSEPDNE